MDNMDINQTNAVKTNFLTNNIKKEIDNMKETKKYGARMIADNKLQTFPNRNSHRDYTVYFTCPEFTCLCPLSGFPDFATIKISYIPDQFCVELKSLKLYINNFRNQDVFHEDVANKILDDLVELLQPRYIKVIADFSVRGNVHTVIEVEHKKR